MADNDTSNNYDSFFQRDGEDEVGNNDRGSAAASAMQPESATHGTNEITTTTTADDGPGVSSVVNGTNAKDVASSSANSMSATNVESMTNYDSRSEDDYNKSNGGSSTIDGGYDSVFENEGEDALPAPLPNDVMESSNGEQTVKEQDTMASVKNDGVEGKESSSENNHELGASLGTSNNISSQNNGATGLKSDTNDSTDIQKSSNSNNANNNAKGKDDTKSLSSNSDSDDIEVVDKPTGWVERPQTSVAAAAPSAGAAASFQLRNQQMPQWMMNNNNNAMTPRYPQFPQYPSSNTTTNSNYPQMQYARYPQINNNNATSALGLGLFNVPNPMMMQSSYPMQLNVGGGYHPAQSYASSPQPYGQPSYLEIPETHSSTWQHIVPKTFFEDMQQRYHAQLTQPRYRKLTLSLINVWEFTIDMEGGQRDSLASGLRAKIKKIAREHVGQGGRRGALFERGSGGEGIVPDDPILKSAIANNNAGNNGDEAGKWRIPLGAYQALLTYLTSDPKNIVEGIPTEQLKAATLGRERMDRKDVPTVKGLIKRGVFPGVSKALAPYQRVGVEFILDKDGRALLADEMGLGKTVQAIAAMSAYHRNWPLLVLCPSTARYHWETELRHWLGTKDGKIDGRGDLGVIDVMEPLKNEQTNVITSGKDIILPRRSTKVVICSFGLIVSLVNSGRIKAGQFNAVIVDESHALKSKSTKRTKAVLPILQAAERCLLLSGTPALARPSELWPQISVLGGRRKDGIDEDTSGIFVDEAEFMSKYVLKGDRGDEIGSKSRLAELHTLLTSTVMIRRMKADILKNLPSKIREKAFINVDDEKMKQEFKYYMQMLRQGRGVLGKLARQSKDQSASSLEAERPASWGGEDEAKKNKEVLHHLYNITGRAKIKKVTKMLKSWLADTSKGKLCIFAHHLDVLDSISMGAGLSNHRGSHKRYIRIDGSTSPKARQEQILQFQTDPMVRIAMLGITAAGVAVTLTASSTVWFAELFWTPAIMIQAEDRCHRIGQQARVRCLYFIAKGTLDEVLWKLIEKKFRDLGEFVEGRENMDIALERTLEDDEEDEILKVEAEADSKKRKSQDDLTALVDTDDLDLKAEIDELVHEEEQMLKEKNEEDDDDPESGEKESSLNGKVGSDSTKTAAEKKADSVIDLMDGEDDDDDDIPTSLTIGETRQLYKDNGVMGKVRLDNNVRFSKLRVYTLRYPGPSYGLIMVSCNGRVVVKSFHSERANLNWEKPEIGHIIVAVNKFVLPRGAQFTKILQLMKFLMRTPPVTVTFAEDEEFTTMFREDILPMLPSMRKDKEAAAAPAADSSNDATAAAAASANVASSSSTVPVPPSPAAAAPPVPPQPNQGSGGVIELLDDE